MAYGAAKEIRQLVLQLQRQGWRVEMTNNGHYKAYTPDGKSIVVFGSTPSGGNRSLANMKSTLRRHGAKV